MDKNQTTLKNLFIELLKKLNNSTKFPREDIEVNYNKVQPFLDLLYTIDDFPVDHSDEDIYSFTNSERKHFDKYHLEDIANLTIEYINKIQIMILKSPQKL